MKTVYYNFRVPVFFLFFLVCFFRACVFLANQAAVEYVALHDTRPPEGQGEWMGGWVREGVGGWVDGWLDWSLAASIGWLFRRVIDWLVVGWMVGSFVDWVIGDWSVGWLVGRVIGWTISRSISWSIGWLVDWLVEWPSGWLGGWSLLALGSFPAA